MNINSHINFDIQPLITFDSVKKAKSIAESHAFSHLPVVEQKMLLGCVAQEDIQGFDAVSYTHLTLPTNREV